MALRITSYGVHLLHPTHTALGVGGRVSFGNARGGRGPPPTMAGRASERSPNVVRDRERGAGVHRKMYDILEEDVILFEDAVHLTMYSSSRGVIIILFFFKIKLFYF